MSMYLYRHPHATPFQPRPKLPRRKKTSGKYPLRKTGHMNTLAYVLCMVLIGYVSYMRGGPWLCAAVLAFTWLVSPLSPRFDR